MKWTDINHQIAARLLEPPYSMKRRGEHLREGICPSCGKKTLWTWAETPGVVQCNRTNKCNYAEPTKAIFPELFEDLNKKYPSTKEHPHQTADAYLGLVRGFDTAKLQGWYEQGKYWHPRGDKGTATVRFYLDAEREVMWERLIDDVTITDEVGDIEIRNKNFKGKFKGHWWSPPGFNPETGSRVYLTEGILDAIALIINGFQACAIMSSGTFPDEAIKPYLGKKIKWTIALDNDSTGRRCLQKHAKKLREMQEYVFAAVSSETETKCDWNDLHKQRRLTREDMKQYRHWGRLELAQNATEKAMAMWQWEPEQSYFVFTFWNMTFSMKIDPTEYENFYKAYSDTNPEREIANKREAFTAAAKIKPIATFRMEFLYFQQPENGEDGQYFFRINYSNNAPEIQLPFSGKVFGAHGDFKKAAMQRAPGAQFTGTTGDLDYMYKHWMGKIPKIVTTLDYVGYDRHSKAYVFNDYAVQEGRLIELNAESFFQLKQGGIKTTVDLKQKLSTRYDTAWLSDFQTAYGTKGVVTLAWWLGCLYVEQIRYHYRSYPFFELVGEAGSGKSDLADFLWKLLGREGETFNPNSSTLAGRTRKMSEVSNIPVVFNETDNEQTAESSHLKKFNWDEQKDLFDGEFGRVTGIKSNDNSTKKPTFKAGLMIVQNIPVQASEAILSRIVHLNFDRSHHSIEGKNASDRLNLLDVEAVSGFLLHAIRMEAGILEHFYKRFKVHRMYFQTRDTVKLARIIENHAKIAALCDCLPMLLPISDRAIEQAQHMIIQMAEDRQQAMNEEHSIVQQFWAVFDYCNSRARNIDGQYEPMVEEHLLNHAYDCESEIAVNLEHFRQRAAELKQELPDSKDLRRWLPSSRKRMYAGNYVVRSRIEGRTMRCWVFKLKAG